MIKYMFSPELQLLLNLEMKSQKRRPGGSPELAELPQSEWNTPVWLTIQPNHRKYVKYKTHRKYAKYKTTEPIANLSNTEMNHHE